MHVSGDIYDWGRRHITIDMLFLCTQYTVMGHIQASKGITRSRAVLTKVAHVTMGYKRMFTIYRL